MLETIRYIETLLKDIEEKKDQAKAKFLQLCGAEDATVQILKALQHEQQHHPVSEPETKTPVDSAS